MCVRGNAVEDWKNPASEPGESGGEPGLAGQGDGAIEGAWCLEMKAVGVATTHSAETLGDADRVVSRLDEISVRDLEALIWWQCL